MTDAQKADLPRITFIGTGSMGRPMILKLLERGYQVTVNDKYPETAKTVLVRGAVWADTPRQAAEAGDIVITCLPLPHHVLENMLGETGALAGMRPRTTWIDTSTTDYHNTLNIAGEAAKKGVYSLEAPVSNLSHMGVDFANVSFYVGGDYEGFVNCEAALNTMGKISFYVGRIGQAQTMKLLTNLLFYTAAVTSGEALAIAQENGIPLHWFWDHIKASQGCSFFSEQVTPFVFDGSFDRSCTIEITAKDMGLTVALAEELGVDLPIGRIVERRYRKTFERYPPLDNHVKVVKLLEEENGITLRIPGLTAPSPYGADPDYVRPMGEEDFLEDQYGRVKPRLPAQYAAPPTDLTEAQRRLATTLTDFLAYVNNQVLTEANNLGRNMGHDNELLTNVVRWSCGISWVSDRYGTITPRESVIDEMAQLDSKLKLPATRELVEVFLSRRPAAA